MPRRGSRGEPPASSFRRATHLDHRYVCRMCSAVVENWQDHAGWHNQVEDHEHGQAAELGQAAGELEDLTARARAEAIADTGGYMLASPARRFAAYWGRAWLEAFALLRIRPARGQQAPAAIPSPAADARRAAVWDRIDSIIPNVTGREA